MTEERVKELIAGGENEKVEFLMPYPKPETLAKRIVAMANNKGGYIFVGIDEHRQPHSTFGPSVQRTLEKAKSLIGGDVPRIEFNKISVNAEPICVISVAPLGYIVHNANPGRVKIVSGPRKKAV